MITSANVYESSILIVDDQAANIELLEQMLRDAGYKAITTTQNPSVVCDLHRLHRFDLILLDLQMPEMDGFQVMEALKQLEDARYLPVLVIAAQPNHKLHALRAGAKDFISKPFDLGEILIRVYNMLEVRLLHLDAASRTQKAEAQFIEAQKMESVGQLASGVAHDFNNILSVIMGYSDMIVTKLEDGHPLRDYAEEVLNASERAVGLTRQLLVFSRKETVQTAVVNLNEIVQKQDKMLLRLIDENITMTITPCQEIGHILADPGYIGQVLMNLVVNARDAMPNGGTLTITTDNITLDAEFLRNHADAKPGEFVMLSVCDTGTGMTEEVKMHLFDAFYTTKPAGKGTGLGLATCQTIVQQLGGYISVHTKLGQGTTFKVYLPRVEKPAFVSIESTRIVPPKRGSETLLVVEDDPSVRHMAKGVLKAQGYTVFSSPNGQAALQMVSDHRGDPIRLVISDVIMPLMGGKVMAEWLKTYDPNLKVLFTSGYSDDLVLNDGAGETKIDFLPKPYTSAMLIHKVREMLDRDHSSDKPFLKGS